MVAPSTAAFHQLPTSADSHARDQLRCFVWLSYALCHPCGQTCSAETYHSEKGSLTVDCVTQLLKIAAARS